MPRHLAVAFLAAAVWLAPQALAANSAYGTEITPTVSLFRMVEVEEKEYLKGKQATRCEHMVDKVMSFGGTRINFMVTFFFVEKNDDLIPDSYCWKPDGTENCLPFTDDIIETWTQRFTECLRYAVQIGFTGISYTPHLDASDGSQWRNVMLINPLEKHEGYSYTDIMLLPLAKATAAVMADNLTVWFATQGEMSQTVFKFPAEYQQVHPYLKQTIIGDNSYWASNVRVGVSTNYNKLCGWTNCNTTEVNRPGNYDLPAIRSLFNAVDFIGISGYPRYDGKTIESMEDASEYFVSEFKLFGLDLQKLINVDGKEFIYSEFGIGGGYCNPENNCAKDLGDTPARLAEEAGQYPFFGIFGPYTRQKDPWSNHLPATVLAGTRQYQEEWYQALSVWLLRKGGPTYRVDAVFLWSLNSWDAVGIHPTSTNKEGAYKNQLIGEVIRTHNTKIRNQEGIMNPGSIAPY